MSTVFLTGYSTKGFYKRHRQLNRSAKKFGIKKIFTFHDTDLTKTNFYTDNKEIFSFKRGAGLWLWKPYYILEALKKIKYGDILFYVDAASLFLEDPKPLIDIAEKSEKGVIAFVKGPLSNGQYCKRDVFVNLDCNTEQHWHAYQAMATLIVFKKTEFSLRFVEEWLVACMNPFNLVNSSLSSKYASKYPALPGFIDHREDQSIFSVLLSKYNLETFRSPTIWGNYLKMPPYRQESEHVCFPYDYMRVIDYDPSPLQNSPYGTIFQINRGKDLTAYEELTENLQSLRVLLSRIKQKIISMTGI